MFVSFNFYNGKPLPGRGRGRGVFSRGGDRWLQRGRGWSRAFVGRTRGRGDRGRGDRSDRLQQSVQARSD